MSEAEGEVRGRACPRPRGRVRGLARPRPRGRVRGRGEKPSAEGSSDSGVGRWKPKLVSVARMRGARSLRLASQSLAPRYHERPPPCKEGPKWPHAAVVEGKARVDRRHWSRDDGEAVWRRLGVGRGRPRRRWTRESTGTEGDEGELGSERDSMAKGAGAEAESPTGLGSHLRRRLSRLLGVVYRSRRGVWTMEAFRRSYMAKESWRPERKPPESRSRGRGRRTQAFAESGGWARSTGASMETGSEEASAIQPASGALDVVPEDLAMTPCTALPQTFASHGVRSGGHRAPFHGSEDQWGRSAMIGHSEDERRRRRTGDQETKRW